MNAKTVTEPQLDLLKNRLELINRSWTAGHYEALLEFYVKILPSIMDCERCGIFLVEPKTGKIWSRFGTGIRNREISPPRSGSVVGDVITTGKVVLENDLIAKDGFHTISDDQTGFQTRNLICVPIKSIVNRENIGALEVLNKVGDQSFTNADMELLEEVSGYLAMAMENIQINDEMLSVSSRLKDQVDALSKERLPANFIAESPAMRAVLEMVKTVSRTPVNVFIQGENGTGKEVIARMIHDLSSKKDEPFIAVNCAAIPETLVESEFFGHEKGAFTGAVGIKKGRFEEADGGTLFMDEVADMPLTIQPKFLRVLQEGEGRRLGGSKLLHYDFRVISATNQNLQEAVNDQRFREDLFYRLFAIEIRLPPLRERREDIVPMALSFMSEISRRFDKPIKGFDSEVLSLFENYAWPGNVRQLRREVERLVALTPENENISAFYCSPEVRSAERKVSDCGPDLEGLTLPEAVKQLEINLIKRALKETSGNKVQASKILDITRQGLDKKLKRYEIQKDED